MSSAGSATHSGSLGMAGVLGFGFSLPQNRWQSRMALLHFQQPPHSRGVPLRFRQQRPRGRNSIISCRDRMGPEFRFTLAGAIVPPT